MREGGKARRVTRLEALLLTTMERGLKGNDRAAEGVIKIALMLGLFNVEPERDFSRLTDDEMSMLEQLTQKIGRPR